MEGRSTRQLLHWQLQLHLAAVALTLSKLYSGITLSAFHDENSVSVCLYTGCVKNFQQQLAVKQRMFNDYRLTMLAHLPGP